MSDLPRPTTEGPWAVSTDKGEDSAEVVCMSAGPNNLRTIAIRQAGDSMAARWPEGVKPAGAHPDMYGIAALPDWIEWADRLEGIIDSGYELAEKIQDVVYENADEPLIEKVDAQLGRLLGLLEPPETEDH